MKGMDLAEILQLSFKLKGYSLEVLELTTFQEIHLDGTVRDRDSFRVHLSRINGTALLMKDEINELMEMAEEWGFSFICWGKDWRKEGHLYEMRLIPKDLLPLVIKQLENVYAYGKETFDYYQENEDFLRFIRDVPTLVYELHTVPEGVTNNKVGEIRSALVHFIFQIERLNEEWDRIYPEWGDVFKSANGLLYASTQIGTPFDFLYKIVSKNVTRR
jgi:hypothetical protein